MFAPDFTLIGRIVTNETTANVAWGDDGTAFGICPLMRAKRTTSDVVLSCFRPEAVFTDGEPTLRVALGEHDAEVRKKEAKSGVAARLVADA